MTAEQQQTTVNIEVDGKPHAVPKGENLVDVLRNIGEEISYFCYHPGLSVVAKCRQCLIGLGDGYKLVPACQMTAQDGMQIRSNTAQVLEARRALLEFTLVNHPVDCVICDKAGECTLQRQYMDWDGKASEINHDKVRKPKKVDLGPRIVLDAERCILCGRCDRFCDEIAKSPQLVFAERGDHTQLTTAPGQQLDNPYSVNTVDICPVGALTDKDFRFKKRVWNLWSTDSVCNGCSAGCSMEIHHADNEAYRLVPRKQWDINLNWMCDDGRLTYQTLNQDRITHPMVDGSQADWEVALERIASVVKPLLENDRDSIGFVLGADASNEDLFVANQLARDYVEARVYLGAKPDNDLGDEILRKNDPNANQTGAKLIAGDSLLSSEQLVEDLSEGKLKVLYVVGDALTLETAALAKLKSLKLLVAQASHKQPISERAHVVLPAAKWAEVDATVTNFENTVKRMYRALEPPAHARAHWAIVTDVGRRLGLLHHFESAEAVFQALQTGVDAFGSAQWGEPAVPVQLRFAHRRG